jgi:hypothetical protein
LRSRQVAFGRKFSPPLLRPPLGTSFGRLSGPSLDHGRHVFLDSLSWKQARGRSFCTVVLVATTLQISYLIGSVTLMALERHVELQRYKHTALNIQEHMEVVGSDGKHVGTVDHTESADRIVLTGAIRKPVVSLISFQLGGSIT